MLLAVKAGAGMGREREKGMEFPPPLSIISPLLIYFVLAFHISTMMCMEALTTELDKTFNLICKKTQKAPVIAKSNEKFFYSPRYQL